MHLKKKKKINTADLKYKIKKTKKNQNALTLRSLSVICAYLLSFLADSKSNLFK